jgi:hypothetical protein
MSTNGRSTGHSGRHGGPPRGFIPHLWSAGLVTRTRVALLRDLADVASSLAHDELEVLLLLAMRVRSGRARYGRLDVRRDRRNFTRETLEEVLDGLFYLGAGLLRHRDRTARRRRVGGGGPR